MNNSREKGNTTFHLLMIMGLVLLAIMLYVAVPIPKANPAANANYTPTKYAKSWGSSATTTTNNTQ